MNSAHPVAIHAIARAVPRMPVPNRHVHGQGHHRSPQRSRPHH
ncbi:MULTISPECIES: hypothetical protein [Vibrio]|nr:MULTISPECIES: hypothetical protein [Vibrio]WHR51121.1 hypothetical protein O8413_14170 [Vibrio furnissii]WJG26662.1 hypothetical protein QSU96_02750 [Vibrio furnissii]